MPLAIVTLATLPTPSTPPYLLIIPASALPSLPNEMFPAAAQQTKRCGDGVGGGGEGYPRWSVWGHWRNFLRGPSRRRRVRRPQRPASKPTPTHPRPPPDSAKLSPPQPARRGGRRGRGARGDSRAPVLPLPARAAAAATAAVVLKIGALFSDKRRKAPLPVSPPPTPPATPRRGDGSDADGGDADAAAKHRHPRDEGHELSRRPAGHSKPQSTARMGSTATSRDLCWSNQFTKGLRGPERRVEETAALRSAAHPCSGS